MVNRRTRNLSLVLAAWISVVGLRSGVAETADDPSTPKTFVYVKTFSKPARLSAAQRDKVLRLANRLAPERSEPWLFLVRGPGCFAGDRVIVFYTPDRRSDRIRRGQAVYLGTVAEIDDVAPEQTAERTDGGHRAVSYAQVAFRDRPFKPALGIPKVSELPFFVPENLDDAIVGILDLVRDSEPDSRHRPVSSLELGNDSITVRIGHGSGSSVILRPKEGGYEVSGSGIWSGG